MKRILPFAAAILVPAALSNWACGTDQPAPSAATATATAATAVATRTATLAIEGMTCASCSVTVRKAAKHLDGVNSIKVDVDAGQAAVTFDPAKVSAQQIADRITDAGYKTTVATGQGA